MFALMSRQKSKYYRSLLPLILVAALLGNSLAQVQTQVSYNRNSPDFNKRSVIEVDPSTLGLNINLPLQDYPGRGLNLPIALYYSSKVWRIQNTGCYANISDPNGPPGYEAEPYYSEHSSAGWNTSLGVPYIEFLSGAEPYTMWFGDTNISDDGFRPLGTPTDSCLDQPFNPCDPGACFKYPHPYYVKRLRVRMPDGSSHELRQSDNAYAYPSQGSGPYVAVDGSRLRYDESASTLYLPDGSRYILNYSSVTQYIDRHGNTLNFNHSSGQWTDTLGRAFTSPPVSTSITAGDYNWALPKVGGGSYTYIFRWRNLTDVRTDPNQPLRYMADRYGSPNNYQYLSPSLFSSAVSDLKVAVPELFNPVVLNEIELPNGQKYKFTYNISGEIDKVYLPTGGYKRYSYAYVPPTANDVNWGVYSQANRGVVDMWESANGTGSDEQHWTFSAGPGPYPNYKVTVTSPDGTHSERYIETTSPGPAYFGIDPDGKDAIVGRAYEESAYNASQQMMRRTLTKWEYFKTPDGSYSVAYPNSFLVSRASRDPRATRQVEILLDTGGDALAKATEMDYDADLNVIATRYYDYVSISQSIAQTGAISQIPNGALLRTEETTFLVNDTSIPQTTRDAYRARNLTALPSKVFVKNGAGTVVAATEYKYDEAAYAPLTNSPAAAQWTDPQTSYRGTPTTVRRWLNISTDLTTGVTTTYVWPNGPWLETHTQTDVCGSVRKAWDARGKVSEITYSSAYAYAYPTQMTTPPPYTSGAGGLGIPFATNQPLTTSRVYDSSTGKLTSETDANGQTTTYSYVDPLQRLTKITRPTGGGETIYEYNDTPGATCACDISVKTRTLQSAGVYVEDYVFFDGLGRGWRTAHGEGGGKWSVTDTQYDSLGRVWKVANPALTGVLAGAPTRGAFALVTANVTTTTYDALSRVLTVTTPDTSVVTTSYSGNQVTAADQANGVPNPINGNQPRNTTRRSVTDALGRLTQVIEAPGSLNYTTNYTYDALDNLRQVNQGSQNRYFLYDSVGRLVRARNPEQDVNTSYNLLDPVTGTGNNQWVLKYAYDENGNLKKRWDARGVLASYNYDDINRNYSIGYSGGTSATPAVERYYDGATRGKGRPWRTISYNAHPVSGQAAYQYREITTYDENGRPTAGGQWFLNSSGQWKTYTMSRSYDLMGT